MKQHRIRVLLAVSLLLFGGSVRAQQPLIRAEQVEAVFLYNFAQFVSWNEAPSRDTTTGFMIGVYGDDSFAEILEAVVTGETVGTLPIRVVRSNELSRLDSCQIVFVRESNNEKLARILTRLGRAGILTVGEQGGFAEGGGAIQFVIEKNRVNFIINMGALRSAGLEASSKLQSVAMQVLD